MLRLVRELRCIARNGRALIGRRTSQRNGIAEMMTKGNDNVADVNAIFVLNVEHF